ncbi:MAG: hypothetical protein ACRDRX_03490 [Pseudonocardiaceae bacterium]
MNDNDEWSPEHFGAVLTELFEHAFEASRLTEASIARRAGLSRKTINAWKGGVLPKHESLLVDVIKAIAESAPKVPGDEVDLSQWRTRYRAAKQARDNRPGIATGCRIDNRSTDRSENSPAAISRLRDYLGDDVDLIRLDDGANHAERLGVHRAPDIPAWYDATLDPYLPQFIDRDCGDKLREWIHNACSQGGFLLITGPPSVGKTRLLYELARGLAGFVVLVPEPENATDIMNRVISAPFVLPKLVIWLDQLQRFLPGPYLPKKETAITLSALKRLTKKTKVVVLATIQLVHAERLRSCHDPDSEPMEQFPDAVKILNYCHGEYFVDCFTPRERLRASELARRDPRLEQALAHADQFHLTQALAGIPALEQRYRRTQSAAHRAILNAAVDLRRIGIRGPVPQELLCETATAILKDDRAGHTDPTWDDVLRDLLREEVAVAPLMAFHGSSGRVEGYSIPDHLYRHIMRAHNRMGCRVVREIWEAMIRYTEQIDLDDLPWVAAAAFDRLLYRYAFELYDHIARKGDPYAREWVAQILIRRDQKDVLHSRAVAGDRCAAQWLAACLAEEGEIDAAASILKPFIEEVDEGAAARIATKLGDKGLVYKLRSRASSHDWEIVDQMRVLFAPQSVIAVLEALGESPETVVTLSPTVAPPPSVGWRGIRAVYAGSSVSVEELRIWHQTGFRLATRLLAKSLFEQGDSTEGLALVRTLAAGHDPDAVELAERLEFSSGPGCSERWTAADTDDLSWLAGQFFGTSELPEKERLREFSLLVVGAGFTSAAEQLAASLGSLGANIRRFGFNPDGTIAGKPK